MSVTRLLQVVIGPNPPARLDKALSRDVPESEALSRTRLARLIGEGAVTRDGEILSDPKAKVNEGDVIEVKVEEQAEAGIEAEAIPLAVVYEDDDLIVIDKPAGMVVHPAPGARTGTLVNALLAHCGDSLSGIGGEKRPGIVHRIDKETSGLLVVAKTDRAHHGLAEQFAAHSIDRHYRAVVHGVPDAGDPRLRGIPGVSFEPGGVLRISARLDRHRHDRQRQAVTQSGGRHAITRARVVEPLGDPAGAALVDCWLETGRTHQIRVHMAHVGHALIGDPTYGGSRRLSVKSFAPAAVKAAHDFPRQALHAATLGFRHPVTGEEVEFVSELPQDMADLITALRNIRTSA